MSNRLYVSGTGMLTAVGGDSAMTFNAVNAGVNQFQSSTQFNFSLDPMTSSFVPSEAFELPDAPADTALAKQWRYRRMLGLATVALTEVLQAQESAEPIALFLAGPEATPSGLHAMDGKFLTHLNEAVGGPIDLQQSRLLCTGRAGTLECLELAFRFMEQTGTDEVLIGGVDCLLDLYTLGCYDAQQRIAAINVNDGFCPSEGACFIWLSSDSAIAKKSIKPLAYVNRPGIGKENGHRYSSEVYRGDGLALAVKIALQQDPGKMIQTVFSSMNGESFSGKEHGVALLRNNKRFADKMVVEHPIDCFGDPGAAIGSLLIGLAAMGISKGVYASPGLIYAASETDLRAACCIGGVV